MPELPEVETIARTLQPLVAGRMITKAQLFLSRSLHQLSLPLEQILGMRVAQVTRRGKLALLCLTPDHKPWHMGLLTMPSERPVVLAVHLRMTGRLFVYPSTVSAGAHTRVILDLDDGNRLFFDDARTFGFMLLATPQLLRSWPFWSTLGLEPLEMTLEEFAQRIQAKSGRIKSVLLDQTVLAGIGNIYADEACFRAGIDPRRSARTLTMAHCAALLEAIQTVLRESIAECGSSIKDYRTARGDAGAFQNYFRVYGRGGLACCDCGTTLLREKVAGRTTVFCPHCQS